MMLTATNGRFIIIGFYSSMALERRGRVSPGGLNARVVDAVLREALLRQAERVAVERRKGGAPDALLLTRADLVG